MNKIEVRLDTQSDVAEFVNIASSIDEEVILVDDTYNRVSAKSIMGCLYSLEFNRIWVESKCENLVSKFRKFLIE